MKKAVVRVLVLCGCAAVLSAAIANADTFKVRVGKLVVTLGGTVSPSKLPRGELAPVKTQVVGAIDTTDGSHPPALREVVVDIDRDAAIDSTGLPICKAAQLVAQDTAGAKRVCGKATVGSGLAHAEIQFPKQPRIVIPSPITVFNGGTGGGKTKLLIHTFITVPVPAAIVTKVTVSSGTKPGTEGFPAQLVLKGDVLVPCTPKG